MTPLTIPVTLPDGTRLEGSAPVVLIGPNGAGKTRFGVRLASASNGTRIPALRSLAFEPTIQPRPANQIQQETQNKINRYSGEFYQQADELNELLSELKAEQADEAVRFRDEWSANPKLATTKQTRLDVFLIIWQQTFPGRTLDFSTYQPRVRSSLPNASSQEPYGANTMSDGERAAVYLITRVLRAPPGVLVIDEPEVHFHALLARSFWDTLQAQRTDCRFIYITHDLPFALSRRGAEIGIVKSTIDVQMIDRTAGIPADLIEEVLGAASLSLIAKRIVFTEGVPGASIDAELYGAWFQSPGTAVLPIGSCRAVQEAVRIFQQRIIVSNVEPLGIVERDYFPERYLSRLETIPGLFVLPVHEVEGLLCLRGVAAAAARHQGMADADFEKSYSLFESQVRREFVGGRLHKHLVERIKCDLDGRLDGLVNTAPMSNDAIALRELVTTAITQKLSGVDPGSVFDEHKQILDQMIADSSVNFLRILPGKDCLRIMLTKLGMPEDLYVDLICKALRQPDGKEEETFKRLKRELVQVLTPVLPGR